MGGAGREATHTGLTLGTYPAFASHTKIKFRFRRLPASGRRPRVSWTGPFTHSCPVRGALGPTSHYGPEPRNRGPCDGWQPAGSQQIHDP